MTLKYFTQDALKVSYLGRTYSLSFIKGITNNVSSTDVTVGNEWCQF